MESDTIRDLPITMDQLLKEVMQLHKSTVKELMETREKYDKLQITRKSILAQTKVLHKECSLIKQENKHLKDVHETLKGRSEDSACKTCHYLQQSMDSLTDAYTKTIEEKDRTIRMLEERLAEKSQLPDKAVHSAVGKIAESRDDPVTCAKGTSPDTTTTANSAPMKRRSEERECECGDLHDTVQQPAGEEVSPGSRRTNLTLPKDRQRRNRYQEVRAPSIKCKENDSGSAGRSKDKETSLNNRKEEPEKNNTENALLTIAGLPDVNSPAKRGKRPRRVSEGDGSFLSEFDSPGKDGGPRKHRKKGCICPEIIVPETMAVDYLDDGEEDSGDSAYLDADINLDKNQDGKKFEPNTQKLINNSEQLTLGPPKACSTQIFSKSGSKYSKLKTANPNAFDTSSAYMDHTVIEKVAPSSNSAKLSVDVTRQEGNGSYLEEDQGPMSPVFVGVQKTELKTSDIKSPNLFDDDHRIADLEDVEDSESPYLLRKPVVLGQRSNVTGEVSDGESQSPSLLRQSDEKSGSVSQSKLLKDSMKPSSSQSETWSERRLRRSTRSKHCNSSGELKQTTLTQSFWSEKKPQKSMSTKTDKGLSLQEIQNLEMRLSPRSLARLNEEHEDNADEVENCSPTSEFKKPLSPSSKTSKIKSPPKIKQKASSLKKSTNGPSEKCQTIDLDETVPPELLQMSLHRGDNFCKTDGQPYTASLAEDQNVSIDPAVQLSLDFPDSMAHTDRLRSPEARTKSKFADLKKEKLMKTFDEDSQAIMSSSKSFKFVPGRPAPRLPSVEGDEECPMDEEAPEDGEQDMDGHADVSGARKPGSKLNRSLNCSYDRVPKKKSPGYAYVDVVRKKDERQKLKAYFCQECEDYFKDVGLSEEERAKRMQKCSRHRARYVPPSTPEHFWSIGFPDTPECEERGYIRKDTQVGPSRFRRKRGLQKRFKGKGEEEDAVASETRTEPNRDLNASDLIFDL